MKQLLLSVALLASLCASAQLADTGTAKQLLANQGQMFYPVLSADGNRLLVSSADYSDLRIYDFTDGTTEAVAPSRADMHRYDAAMEAARSIAEPFRISQVSARTEGSTLYISVGNNETACSPAGQCAGYLWESVSPDGTKIAFVAAGKGIYVTDLKGNVIARCGKYEAPVWFGNSHLVAMHATDDGHQYSSSQIVLLTADGTAKQELTAPESFTMYPTASIAAGKIVYNTIDGRLFELPVTLK